MTGPPLWRRRRLRRVVSALLLLAVIAGCAPAGATREQVRAHLDATYETDPARSGTWLSSQSVDQTADAIAGRINPRDRFTEQQTVFMRNRDWMVAVFPEATGSRVEFDEYSRMRTRYLPFIVGYWGSGPRSYGPRGERASRAGGGFRGGGPGAGK